MLHALKIPLPFAGPSSIMIIISPNYPKNSLKFQYYGFYYGFTSAALKFNPKTAIGL